MIRGIFVLTFLIATACGPRLQTFAQTAVPPLKYRERVLSNGLHVVSLERKSSPTVAIQVWYHVGGKDDPEQRSGFAHLFEHLMFKSSKNLKSEQMDRLTEDVGGFNNAFTQPDVTVYYEVVPSNYMETLLWAEAERLSNLNVDEANFKSERSVVQEEFRQSILAPPYGKLRLLTERLSFAKHPYGRSVIGSIEDLDSASLENVRAFHSSYYRPDNATLVVVGDFDQKQLDDWVDKYFGRVARPATTLPRVTIKEPVREAEKRFVEYGQNVPLTAVRLTYLAPGRASADADPLKLATAILSGGTSSRLYRSLVYEQQLAQSADANDDLREDLGLYTLNALVAGSKKPDDVEHAMLTEIQKMQETPVTASELSKAKNQIITERLHSLETNSGVAFALGEAAVYLKDTGQVNAEISRLQSVTAEDIQRVMKQYFTPRNRLVIYYEQDQRKPSSNGNTKKEGRR